MNDEVVGRGEELTEVNSFLESILSSLRSAVVVTDRDLHVRAWSPKAENLWGLGAAEVQGKPFMNLDIGFPVDQLRSRILDCLKGDGASSELVGDAINRRGKRIRCKVNCAPLPAVDKEVRGVILLMEEISADA